MTQVRNPLNQFFPRFIFRVSFPRENELDGPLRIVHEVGQTVQILQKQPGSLIRRETPREADRQDARVQQIAGIFDGIIAFLPGVGIVSKAVGERTRA